jgi:hypothetical protein
MVVWSPNLSITFAEISFHWGPKNCPYLRNQDLWGIHPLIYYLRMPKPKFQLYMASLFSPPPSHEKTPCYFKEVLTYIDHETFELTLWVPFGYKIFWAFQHWLHFSTMPWILVFIMYESTRFLACNICVYEKIPIPPIGLHHTLPLEI